MEKIPIYLRFFFIRIRRHSGEDDYFVHRFENMDADKMAIETQMIEALYKNGLILLPTKKLEKTFEPAVLIDSNGGSIHLADPTIKVPYPAMFFIAPAGKYLLIEDAFGFVGTLGWTIAVAAISGFVGSQIR